MVFIVGNYTDKKSEEYRGLKLDIKDDDVFELEAHEFEGSWSEVVVVAPWHHEFRLDQYETMEKAEEAMQVFGEQIKSGYKLRLSYDHGFRASLVPPCITPHNENI